MANGSWEIFGAFKTQMVHRSSLSLSVSRCVPRYVCHSCQSAKEQKKQRRRNSRIHLPKNNVFPHNSAKQHKLYMNMGACAYHRRHFGRRGLLMRNIIEEFKCVLCGVCCVRALSSFICCFYFSPKQYFKFKVCLYFN